MALLAWSFEMGMLEELVALIKFSIRCQIIYYYHLSTEMLMTYWL